MKNISLSSIKKEPIIFMLQIYIFCVMSWDYEAFYQVALVLLFAFSLLKYKRLSFVIKHSTFLHGYFFMTLYFGIQYFVGATVSKRDSLDYLITMSINLMAIVGMAVAIRTKEQLLLILKTIVFTSFVLATYNVIMNLNGLFNGALATHCYKLFFLYPSYSHSTVPMYCAFSIMSLVLMGYLKKMTGGMISLICYFVVYVILSASRNALILVAFALVVYPFMFAGKKENMVKRFLGLVSVFALLVVGMWAILNIPSLYNAIGKRVESVIVGISGGDYTESSASSRNIMLMTGINLVKENWLFGYGLNTFRTFPGSFGTWSHNQYIESLVSGGIIGLFSFMYFNIKSLKILYKKMETRLGGFFICLMIYMLINNLFNVSYVGRFTCVTYGLADAYLMFACTASNKKKDIRLRSFQSK